MNWLDIVLLIPLAWFVWRGWRHGLVREATNLLGLLAGIWAALHLSTWIADLIGLEGDHAVLVAFFVAFMGAVVLAYLLGRAVEGLLKQAHLSLLNRLAGAAFGMLKAICLLSVLISQIVLFDHKETLITPATKEGSLFYKPVSVSGGRVTQSLKQYIAEHGKEWKEALQ